jgi:hypothetical protein
MKRKIIAAFAIVLTGGIVVAMVRAQESSRSDVYSSPHRSVLKRSTDATESNGERVGDGLRDGQTTGPRLVDRLKQIRSSVVGDGRGTTTLSPPRRIVRGPAAGQPVAESAGGTATRVGSEPRLLNSPGGVAADPTRSAAPRGVFADGSESARRRRSSRSLRDSDESASEVRNPSRAVQEPLEHPLGQTNPQIREAVPNSLLTSVGPALQVDTFGPQAIVVGREAEFKVTLTNQSVVPAHDVFIRVTLPTWVETVLADPTAGDAQLQTGKGGAQELIWRVNQFAAGGQEVLTLSVIPRENRSFNLAVDWTLRSLASATQIQVQQPELQMALVGPKEIRYGETAVYTIQISNPGTGEAEDVQLDFSYGSERLPRKRVGNLAPGEETEIDVELSARQAGALRVEASATAAGGLTVETIEQVVVRRAKLEVQVVGPAVKFSGGVASYEFRVLNVGDAPADNVVAEVTLPPGASTVGHEAQAERGQSLVKDLGTISPDSERTFRVQCQLTNPGENVVKARAKAIGNLLATYSCATQVRTFADLKLTVDDPPGPISIDQDTVYDLTIINRGSRAAKDVKIVAQFSKGVEPLSAIGISARLVPGQVLFKPIARIEPGEEVRLKITAKANLAGNHRFRAEVRCFDPHDTVLVEEETTYFYGDDLLTADNKENTSR